MIFPIAVVCTVSVRPESEKVMSASGASQVPNA